MNTKTKLIVAFSAVLAIIPTGAVAVTSDAGLNLINAGVARDQGLTGAGMTIGFIDVGINTSHSYFQGKIVDGLCVSKTNSCPNGSNYQTGVAASEAPANVNGLFEQERFHGNMVAGIAAGIPSSLAPGGIATGANIIMARDDSRSDSGLTQALDFFYSVRERHNLKAVSISMGRLPSRDNYLNCESDSPAMSASVQRLVDAGIAVVAAAGNDQNPYGVLLPSCLPNVISVGAVTNTGEVAEYSNSGQKLDVFAPFFIRTADYAGYMQGDGTSAATPVVAATYLLAKELNPTLTVSQFATALRSTGVPTQDVLVTKNRIDIPQLLAALNTAPTPVNPGDFDNLGPADGDQSVWVKRISDSQIKFYAKYPQLNQKIQFMYQDSTGRYRELAWMRIQAEDLDSQGHYQDLTNGIYFVRTLNLVPGKNRLKIFVDGVDAIGTKTYSF